MASEEKEPEDIINKENEDLATESKISEENAKETLEAAEDLMGALEAGDEPFTNFQHLMTEGIEIGGDKDNPNLSHRNKVSDLRESRLMYDNNNFHSLPTEIKDNGKVRSFLDKVRDKDNRKMMAVGLLLVFGVVSLGTAFSILSNIPMTPTTVETPDVLELNAASTNRAIQNFLESVDMSIPGVSPSLVWFFGFPQSGSSYVSHLVQVISDRATATNFGSALMDMQGHVHVAIEDSKRVYGDTGPALYSGEALEVPEKRILTWTNSDGTCRNCHPRKYMYNYGRFREVCWEGTVMKDGESVAVKYDPAYVKSSVHLYRDPFDNIVLRFWAEREEMAMGNHLAWLNRYSPTHLGFQAWCNDRDAEWYDVEKAWYGEETMALAEGVICRQEFYKYIMFHNNVVRTRLAFNLPSFILKYEDLYLHYEKTMGNLLSFLELPVLREPPSKDVQVAFSRRYFTDDHRNAAKKFMKSLALPKVYEILEEYDDVEDAINKKEFG